jgi:hypothetical protein
VHQRGDLGQFCLLAHAWPYRRCHRNPFRRWQCHSPLPDPSDIRVTNDLERGIGGVWQVSDLRLWVELRGFEPLTPSMRTTGRAVSHGRSRKCRVRTGLLGAAPRRRGCCTSVLHVASCSRSGPTALPRSSFVSVDQRRRSTSVRHAPWKSVASVTQLVTQSRAAESVTVPRGDRAVR